jgi:alpha-D-ribose 1-methylphosphonate 5-triphosphate synthase subunit PhnG
LQQQNKITAIRDARSEKKLMQQRNITYCNTITRLLQLHRTKYNTRKQHQKKKTNATKKNYLLQQQGKATATTETKA